MSATDFTTEAVEAMEGEELSMSEAVRRARKANANAVLWEELAKVQRAEASSLLASVGRFKVGDIITIPDMGFERGPCVYCFSYAGRQGVVEHVHARFDTWSTPEVHYKVRVLKKDGTPGAGTASVTERLPFGD